MNVEFEIIGDYAYVSSSEDLSTKFDVDSMGITNLGYDFYGTTWSGRVPKGNLTGLRLLIDGLTESNSISKSKKYTPNFSSGTSSLQTRWSNEIKRLKKPSFSRKRSPNYVPNMRKMKSRDLSSWLKAGKGTPKQRRLAYRIIKSRRN